MLSQYSCFVEALSSFVNFQLSDCITALCCEKNWWYKYRLTRPTHKLSNYPWLCIFRWDSLLESLAKKCGFLIPVFTVRIRELKQSWARRPQEHHKFAYLMIKSSSFARYAREFLNFGQFRNLSRPNHDLKWLILQLCRRREQLTTNLHFFFSF